MQYSDHGMPAIPGLTFNFCPSHLLFMLAARTRLPRHLGARLASSATSDPSKFKILVIGGGLLRLYPTLVFL
jgi:hypothetical protein